VLDINTLLSFINFYQQLGLVPIPLRAKDKAAIVEWKKHQTIKPTSETINSWFKDRTINDVNVGLLCGQVSGNLVVLDIDNKDMITKLFPPKELQRLAEETLITKTARGIHIYFRSEKSCPNFRLPEFHIDIKSQRGYVVAPPSIHPSGKIYEFLNDNTYHIKRLPDFERWFWKVLETKLQWKPPERLEEVSQMVRTDQYPPYRGKHPPCIQTILAKGVSVGNRHIISLALACYFKNVRRYSKKRTLGILLEWHKKLPELETFSVSELKKVVEDAYKGQYNYGCRIFRQWCVGETKCVFGRKSEEFTTDEVLTSLVREQALTLNASMDFTPETGLFYGYPVKLDMDIEKLVVFSWNANPNDLACRTLDVDHGKTETLTFGDIAFTFKVNPMLYEAVKEYPEFKKVADDVIRQRELKDSFHSLEMLLRRYIELPDERMYKVLDVWIRGTYMFQMFNAYPYIWFVGMIRTGKTKATTLLSLLSFRGHLITNPSPSFIFRVIEAVKPTLCIDEATGLDFSDKDIVAILNAGYKKGIRVPRVNMDKDGLVEFFDCYCPKVINGLTQLSSALIDRSIKIEMVESDNSEIMNKAIESNTPLWSEIRYELLCWALRFSNKIWLKYSTLECPNFMSGRDWELWRPLFAIASVLGDDYLAEISEFVEEYVKQRLFDLEGEIAHQILRALLTLAPERQAFSSYLLSSLFYEVQARLGGKNAPKWLTYRRLQFILKSVLKCVKKIETTKEGTFYVINWNAVRERAKKRGIEISSSDEEAII